MRNAVQEHTFYCESTRSSRPRVDTERLEDLDLIPERFSGAAAAAAAADPGCRLIAAYLRSAYCGAFLSLFWVAFALPTAADERRVEPLSPLLWFDAYCCSAAVSVLLSAMIFRFRVVLGAPLSHLLPSTKSVWR